MERKLYYTVIGCTLSLANIVLIETKFNIVGMGFGIAGALFLIKALLIRKGDQ